MHIAWLYLGQQQGLWLIGHPQVIDALIEENELEIVSDLFADPAESEGEIAFLKAVKRYQQFSERYSAE